MRADAPLDGAVAIVTGASGNLGPVWIRALRDAGATVVGVDVAEGEDVEVADVRDRGALEAVLERVTQQYATPSILVNNAGVDRPPGPEGGHQTVEEFASTLDVNLAGTYAATTVFGGAMVEAGRGAIVNIGSLYASVAPVPSFYDHLDGFVKPAAYGASKAGVVQLTKYFARLWGPHGVRVNTLSPGGVRAAQDEQFLAKYCARVPLGRMAEPEDLTGPLVFLASDASRYLTGHELRVDGGFTA